MKKVISFLLSLVILTSFSIPVFAAKGDPDGDGVTTVADALIALRIAAKLAPETANDIAIMDIDGDGHISVADALSILRVAAKLADPFEPDTPKTPREKLLAYVSEYGTLNGNSTILQDYYPDYNEYYAIIYDSQTNNINLSLSFISSSNTFVITNLNIETGFYSFSVGDSIELYGFIDLSTFSRNYSLQYSGFAGDSSVLASHLNVTRLALVDLFNWFNWYLGYYGVGVTTLDFGFNQDYNITNPRGVMLDYIYEHGTASDYFMFVRDNYPDSNQWFSISHNSKADYMNISIMSIDQNGTYINIMLNIETGFYSLFYGNDTELSGYINPATFTSSTQIQYTYFSGNTSILPSYLDLTRSGLALTLDWFSWYLNAYNVGLTIRDFGFTAFS